jgi:hypothetical protein
MDAAAIILERLDAYAIQVESAIGELTDEDLSHQPGPNDNPAGWLMWHMTRFEDRSFAHIAGRPQVWTEGDWHGRFGLPEDPVDTGAGHTLERVAVFRPRREDLLGYFAAVRPKTRECLSGLTPENLDEEVDDFLRDARIRVGAILGRFFGDHISHVGQICYIRGHLKGWGKYGR